jgi:hypothetical protein
MLSALAYVKGAPESQLLAALPCRQGAHHSVRGACVQLRGHVTSTVADGCRYARFLRRRAGSSAARLSIPDAAMCWCVCQSAVHVRRSCLTPTLNVFTQQDELQRQAHSFSLEEQPVNTYCMLNSPAWWDAAVQNNRAAQVFAHWIHEDVECMSLHLALMLTSRC